MDYSYYGIKCKRRKLVSLLPNVFHSLLHTLLIVTFICAIGSIFVGGLFAYGMYKGIVASTPKTTLKDLRPNGYSTAVYDMYGNQISKLVTTDSNRIYVNLDKIPEHTQHAFIAIEDRRFYEHQGVDVKGLMRAFITGIKSHNFSQGASTITQQLIKNNVFTSWTSESKLERWKRKIQEQQIALDLEKDPTINKDIILELYLNTINLGQSTLGIQAASLRYFDKDVSDLTLSESAVLASIPQNPTKYNPITHPENNAERHLKVLNDMLEENWITKEEYDEAVQDNVYERINKINVTKENDIAQTYYIDALVGQVLEDLQNKLGMSEQQAYYTLYSGGLTIYSAQDTVIQKICDDYINNPDNFPSNTKYSLNCAFTCSDVSGNQINTSELNVSDLSGVKDNLYSSYEDAEDAIRKYKSHLVEQNYTLLDERINIIPQPQVSLTIIDQATGQVRAIIGGRGDKNGSRTFNRAVDSTRQPGSTFKVVSTYLPAIDTGKKTLASTQVDEPFNYDSGRPVKNYYSGYKGTCTMRDGITQSLNIVTVKTLTDITPQVGFEYLQKMGFTTLVDKEKKDGKVYSDVTQALALGGITHGVKNVELTESYATIANLGTYHKYSFYSKVLDHDGNVLLESDEGTRIFKPTTAYLITSAMKDVLTKGTGKLAYFSGQELAGKTGTTSDNKDVWFAGYSPYYTCSVWTGYDNNEVLRTADERNLSKQIWHDIMQEIHKDLPYKQFKEPSGISAISICTNTHKRAKESCHSYVELFDSENITEEVCNSSHYTPQPHVSHTTPQLTPEQIQAILALQAQQAAAAAQQQQ